MKKTLSIILAAVMMLTVCTCAFSVFAAGGSNDSLVCKCNDCAKVPNGCHCCAACPYLDKTYLLSCAKNEDGEFKGSFCCGTCTGIWPCDCDCGCPACANKTDAPDDEFDPVFSKDQQNNIVKWFQSILKKVSDVFDMLFDAIFDFLKLGEVFG